jgi:Zn-dependent peptidase ImmA (M78 family)
MTRVEVKPKLLRWARERAGLDLGVLTHRFPQLADWERGTARPTLKQIEHFAKVTHTPVGYLFLQEPPIERVPIPDFRTVGNNHIERPSPDLLDTIYCQQSQEWYRDFARSMGDEPLAFVGSLRGTGDVVQMAARIRRALGFDVDERQRIPSWTDALRRFIEQADAMGVLMMVSGVVGSNNRRKLDPQEFHKFALADDLAPLVFINGENTKVAQMFTLAHELSHIWLGQSAVSDAQVSWVPDVSDAKASLAPEHHIERWCNRVAAELLVPLEVLRAEYDQRTDLRHETDRLARRFKVSTLVILRRIHDAGGLTCEQLWEAYEAELQRLHEIRKGSGGDFYLTLGARVSKRFARALVVSTLEGRSSFTEAFRLLGFKKMATFRDLWWDNQSFHYDLVTSAAVIEELSQGSYPSKEQALALISHLPLLPTVAAIDAVVETYIAHYVMPRNSLGDALHLALTSYHGCHFLLTWNCIHLANANKFEHIRHVNTLLGFYVPILTTPVELLNWEGASDDTRPSY